MFIMLGYDGERMEDLRATVDHLKHTAPDVFLTTVSYPIKGTPYYDQVADRLAPQSWADATDRDLVVRGRPVRTYYDFARRWMTAEVAKDQHWRGGRYAQGRAVRIFGARRQDRHGRHRQLEGTMIVLFNPWSTPSPKKPLPMSLLALGSMLDGEFDYTHRRRQHRARSRRRHHRDRRQAADYRDRRHRDARAAIARRRVVQPAAEARAAGRADHLGRLLSLAACRCVPERADRRRLRDRPGRADDPRADARDQRAADRCRRLRESRTGENGAIHRTPPRALTPLDELPDWPYQQLPMERYFHKHYLGDRVATHHSSFGCPFACNFCAVVGMSNRKWVAQSPERVGSVLEKFSRLYGADAVQFHDMDFFISEARTQAIADRLKPLGMTWWALGRVDELMRYRDTTWTAMKQSGLKMVFCGAESGSTDMLKRMNKGGTASADLTIELAARMKSHGIVPEFSFVVGNPPDPEADLAQTLSFIRRLKQVNDATEIILYVYSPVPMDGTFYDAAREQGFTFPDTLEGWVSERWQTFALRRDPSTPWSHGEVRQKVRDFESVLNAYYPTVTDTRMTPARRRLLRAASAWRYHAKAYTRPVELNLLQRAFRYQRPETTGF